MKTKFYNSDGTLTAYAFACGYVEKKETNRNNCKDMYKEHGIYNVVGFIKGVHFYVSFEKLTDARKYYRSIKI